MNLDQKIEAILFVKGEPMSFKRLAELLNVDKHDIMEAVTVLESKLADRGLQLVTKGESVMLGTNAELGPLLGDLRKAELSRELSKASLETISVILYKEGATRADIDYIRGVNSSFILRNLLVRGLVEKITDPSDSRRYLYKPSFDLLSFMGVSKLSELPDFDNMKTMLDKNAAVAAENDQI
jgi:segregation and condensation protein B